MNELRRSSVFQTGKVTLTSLDLTAGPLRTLAFIAFRQPVSASYVARVRGKAAHRHISKLKKMELVTDKRIGQTTMLLTTRGFSDQFNLPRSTSSMKKKLQVLAGAKAR